MTGHPRGRPSVTRVSRAASLAGLTQDSRVRRRPAGIFFACARFARMPAHLGTIKMRVGAGLPGGAVDERNEGTTLGPAGWRGRVRPCRDRDGAWESGVGG